MSAKSAKFGLDFYVMFLAVSIAIFTIMGAVYLGVLLAIVFSAMAFAKNPKNKYAKVGLFLSILTGVFLFVMVLFGISFHAKFNSVSVKVRTSGHFAFETHVVTTSYSLPYFEKTVDSTFGIGRNYSTW